MSRVRVLHVSQPVEGGVPTVVRDYVEQLSRAGAEVAVACPPGPLAGAVADLGIEWLRWDADRRPGAGVAGETRRLGRVTSGWAPDVVHLHSSKAGLAGRLALRGRLPTVFQPHAWSFQAASGAMRAASIAWERRGARWSDVTVCVSQAERDAGRREGVGGDLEVVLNRVDTSSWTPRDQTEARSAAGVSLDAPIAVCVGRLCQQKGQLDLVRVWRDVRAELPDAQLVLVGDGPDRDRISAAIRDTGDGVHLVGHSAAVAGWFGVADVVVAPSRWEAMAMVPLEAQACGRAVIATDVSGMGEAVAGSGVIVPPLDDDALRIALVRALADREGLARRGLVAREQVAARPSWQGLAPQLLEIYDVAGAGVTGLSEVTRADGTGCATARAGPRSLARRRRWSSAAPRSS